VLGEKSSLCKKRNHLYWKISQTPFPVIFEIALAISGQTHLGLVVAFPMVSVELVGILEHFAPAGPNQFDVVIARARAKIF